MSTFVRTNHTTFSLHQISKMVVILLLIFLPVLALANPVYQSSNRYSNPSTVGASSMQYQLESYKMANTSTYQVGTTYNPAQTIYEPFSNANPSSSSPSRIGGRKNIEGDENDPNGDINYGDGDDYGGNDDPGDADSPLGDAWSLLIFAAMAAGVIALRKKQAA
jgi:hypothetical protein